MKVTCTRQYAFVGPKCFCPKRYGIWICKSPDAIFDVYNLLISDACLNEACVLDYDRWIRLRQLGDNEIGILLGRPDVHETDSTIVNQQ